MTTHPNAQLLQNSYRAIGQGDLYSMLNRLSEDMTWIHSTVGCCRSGPPGAG
jgi:ketosteroid isomerase-like protein